MQRHWQHAHEGYLDLCCLPIGYALALATWLTHGGLAHGCFLDLGYVSLPWMVLHGDCHGLRSMQVGMSWPWHDVYGGYLCLGCLPIGGLLS